jgi:hypothetical protein
MNEESLAEIDGGVIAVDVASVYDSDFDDDVALEDDDNACSSVDSEVLRQSSMEAFSRRAYVAQGAYRVGWIVDEERPNCMSCARIFGLLRRRHHCRQCGGIFCRPCSTGRKVILELLGASHRVCDKCFALLQTSPTVNENQVHLQTSERAGSLSSDQPQDDHGHVALVVPF